MGSKISSYINPMLLDHILSLNLILLSILVNLNFAYAGSAKPICKVLDICSKKTFFYKLLVNAFISRNLNLFKWRYSCYYYFRQYSPKYTIVFDRMERFQEERFTIDLNINDSLSKIEKLCYILKSTNPVVINIFWIPSVRFDDQNV